MIAGEGLTVWQGHHFVWDKSVAVENNGRFSPDLRNRRNLRFQIRNLGLKVTSAFSAGARAPCLAPAVCFPPQKPSTASELEFRASAMPIPISFSVTFPPFCSYLTCPSLFFRHTNDNGNGSHEVLRIEDL